ncbi:DUF2187 family protein [Mesobacillus foraminis]|uniref:Uncharacterized protein YkvS n=1 Tax=Mesobacillus foraminis TaxID=279826 RepID=A0A4R2AXQ9_9BACI|nr:DUF2187 family protein [Mesobacillus foraminis]TCN18455.1 uncharacterized protein YkvS [Mesobacillus foraminis]
MTSIANIGDEIIFKKGIAGIVEKVNDNSVIVKITENPTKEEYRGNITVVAHKNYKIINKKK